MSQLLERPLPKSRAPAPKRSLLSDDQDVRAVQTGILLTLILWPLFVWLIASIMQHMGEAQAKAVAETPQYKTFEIELNEEEQEQKPRTEPPPPNKFVETNPDAPENVPDKTNNFGAQNQQVAQEKPTPNSKSDAPATEGKKDFESNQIVDGNLTPQEAPPPAPPPMPEMQQAQSQQQAAREQNPLSGTEKLEGTDAEGLGASIAKPSENATAVPQHVEGSKDSQSPDGALQMTVPRVDPQRPQPRPVLDRRRARPAIMAERLAGTDNIGMASYDARWSSYGQYLQQMIETIQIQWERILDQSRVYPPPGSSVRVTFRINAEGEIAEVVKAEGSGGTQFERACISGITARAPYGKWPEDMVAALGQMQEMTFTFYYGAP